MKSPSDDSIYRANAVIFASVEKGGDHTKLCDCAIAKLYEVELSQWDFSLGIRRNGSVIAGTNEVVAELCSRIGVHPFWRFYSYAWVCVNQIIQQVYLICAASKQQEPPTRTIWDLTFLPEITTENLVELIKQVHQLAEAQIGIAEANNLRKNLSAVRLVRHILAHGINIGGGETVPSLFLQPRNFPEYVAAFGAWEAYKSTGVVVSPLGTRDTTVRLDMDDTFLRFVTFLNLACLIDLGPMVNNAGWWE